MANTIKGITVEIGGDTTKLGKALEEVNKKTSSLSKELGQVNKMLKFDPDNAELLAQKQDILSEAVANTSAKLETLKEAERQVQEQFERGEASAEQVRELRREIISTEQRLENYQRAVEETAEAMERVSKESDGASDGIDETGDAAGDAADSLEDMGDAAADAGDGLSKADVATGSFLGNLKADVLEAFASKLVEIADETLEYRTAMGKLDTAFTTNGFTVEEAASTYQALQSVLGEADQSVEAANHLAQLTNNAEDLSTWTDICTGIFATFGDSLPIEGLTEAANETAKVGTVTGSLADALNWAGVNEDDFNESLGKCNSEQERSQLIMDTLNGLYSEASDTYKELNADVMESNSANDQMQASLAKIGEEVQPLITDVTELVAQLVEYLTPALETLLDNLPTLAALVGTLAAAFLALKINSLGGLSGVLTKAKTAFAGLNATMRANPIGVIITIIGLLVSAFIYLWNNCEEFREFWINLWEKIKELVSNAVEKIKDTFNSIKTFITETVPGFFTSMKEKATSAVKTLISNVVNFFSDLPSNLVSVGKNLVMGLWNGINDKVTWLKNKISGFTKSVLNSIKSFFGVHSPSTETAWIGEMLDQGLAEGIENSINAPVKAMRGVSSGILDAANDIDGLSIERGLRASTAATAANNGYGSIGSKLDAILSAIEQGKILTIDGDTFVGATAGKYDSALGQRRLLAARGAL